MSDLPAAPRFRLVLAGLRHSLTVVTLHGTEALSQPYAFTLDVVSEHPDLTPARLMYQAAFLTLGEDGAGIHGQIHAAERSHYRPGPVCLRLSLGPRLACLAQRYTPRVFQHMSAVQIITRVLGEHGLHAGSYRFDLKAPCALRSFCAQYRENDLQLIQRLCAEEGIHYHFVHAAQGHELVFGSGLCGARRSPQAPWSRQPEQAGVMHFTVCHVGREPRDKRAGRRAEGHSTLPFVSSGHLLPLTGHPQSEWNHLWRVTHVEHRVGGEEYANRFVAQPWEVACNVPTVSAPALPALQRAWVVGAFGQPAERDASGRIRVQFEWGLQGNGARFADCWLIVQPGLRASLFGGMAVLVGLEQGSGHEPQVIACLDNDTPLSAQEQDVDGAVQVRLDAHDWLDEQGRVRVAGGPVVSLADGGELSIQIGASRVCLGAGELALSSPNVTFSASMDEPAVVTAQAPGNAPQGQATYQGEEQESQP